MTFVVDDVTDAPALINAGEGLSAWPIATPVTVSAPVAMAGSFKANQTIVAGSFTNRGSLPRGSLQKNAYHPGANDDHRRHLVQHGAVDSDLE